ncbi:hypothetical protein Glove_86g132 [Diversispora epigaea]|uniref:Protein kinase domain-containing protein n=1 Tax=Diversispora epigaea TaxID=1348612 RepID=A0A397JH71_9GLOM|nr:hypothetical protein Glove_86g132 [Diversispora epigaea]
MQLNHRNEYGKCTDCQQDNTGPQWCNTCNSIRFQREFNKWTSEDAEIDEFIQQTQLKATKYEEVIEWIPFDRFNNIKYLDKGGFGKVFRAAWSDGYIISWDSQRKIWKRSQRDVCLKSLNTLKKKGGFLQEIKYQLKFRGIWAIAIYGITKSPTENEYMMVMQYARYGSLRKMLNDSFKELTWENKIKNLYYIALGLAKIHETGLMHKNFHSGNIVNETKTSSYITDFRLCKPVTENNLEKIYGVISYMAPETLIGGEYTQASDIYSFGMIMYEVFTSYPPYYNIPHNKDLVISICEGQKPEIMCEIPQLLKDLMEKCWDTDPSNRPKAIELKSHLRKYFNNSEINEHTEKANEANKLNKNFIQYNPKMTHPQAIYTSRYLPFLKLKKVEHDIKQWEVKEYNSQEEPKIEKNSTVNIVFGDILNNFQFSKSIDNINKYSSEDIYETDFFSVKATIMLGTTATTDLENLLLEQKDAIDNILKSQPVYAVGPNFQQGYSIPCITCYVSKPLATQVLAKLSALFDHEFEIEEQVVEHMEEDTSGCNDNQSDPLNKSNRINNDLSNGNMEMRDSNGNENGDIGNGDENNNSRNDDRNDNGNDDEIGNGNVDGDGDGNGGGGGGGGGKGKGKENEDKFMEVSSSAKVLYENEFQSFNINAKLWANVSLDKNLNTLEFEVNLFACGVGQMLNEKCRKLHNFVGFYIDSVEIRVSPLSHTPNNISDMISLKNQYFPQKHFTSVDHSINHGKTRGLGLNISQNPGATAAYNVSNNKGFKVTTNDWRMEAKTSNTDGVLWPYHFNAQNLYKDGENQCNLPSTDIHSGHWYIVDNDNMKGFSITIKQVLTCTIKPNRFNFKSFVIKCPKVVHTLVITFNNLKEFNKEFAELRKKFHHGSSNPEIELEKKNHKYSITESNKGKNLVKSEVKFEKFVTGFERKLEKSETGQNSKKK